MNAKAPHRIWFHSENGPTIGGSDYYLGRLIDGLDPTQWQVSMLARPGYPLSRISDHAQRIEHITFGPELQVRSDHVDASRVSVERPVDLPPRSGLVRRAWSGLPRGWRRDFGLLRNTWQLEQLFRQRRPTLIHSADGGAQPVAIAAARAGIPVVLGYSAPPPKKRSCGLQRRIEQQTFRSAQVRITKSSFARDDWANYLNCSTDSFTVIPNGIDLSPYLDVDPSHARRQLGLPLEQLLVGMTARIEREKGIDVVLEAIRCTPSDFPAMHFVITGDGSELHRAKRMVDAQGLASKVTFLGHQLNIPLVTSAYDIAIVPSVWNEPFGWTVLEGMAAAKPVIASRVGGIPEIVREGETGMLVPPESPNDLLFAIRTLAENANQRQRMGCLGRQRVIQCFNQERMLETTYQLYHDLVGDPRRRSLTIQPPIAGELPCGTP